MLAFGDFWLRDAIGTLFEWKMPATLLSLREISAVSLSCQCHCCAENEPLPKEYLVSDGHMVVLFQLCAGYAHFYKMTYHSEQNANEASRSQGLRVDWLSVWPGISTHSVSFDQLLWTIKIQRDWSREGLLKDTTVAAWWCWLFWLSDP